MDDAMIQCSLEATWKDLIIRNRLVKTVTAKQRYYTGDLGKYMIRGVVEVWVCDMLDHCALSSASTPVPRISCATPLTKSMANSNL